jgi:Rps23 Pro-64 3,4-dihydroxylase Tpa1-like proline 4-hydroxylase
MSDMIELINPNVIAQLKNDIVKSEPFPHVCIDNFLREDFANEVFGAFPAFEEAQKMGREFKKVNEKKKIQITNSALFPPAIKKLNDLFASQEFIDTFAELFKIPNLIADPDLNGGGIHETNSGGHLDVHVDFNFLKDKQWHRRMNLLLYFNKDWKEEYGGYFDIWDKDVKKCHGAFAPSFNRLCGFATSEISFHGVTPLTCPPDIMRKSFAVYYYTKEAPDHWSGQHHTTIFKPRPDEWVKGSILMPYEAAKQNTRLTINSIKNSIKSIFK